MLIFGKGCNTPLTKISVSFFLQKFTLYKDFHKSHQQTWLDFENGLVRLSFSWKWVILTV